MILRNRKEISGNFIGIVTTLILSFYITIPAHLFISHSKFLLSLFFPGHARCRFIFIPVGQLNIYTYFYINEDFYCNFNDLMMLEKKILS